ncbi:MAG: hypothetical protein ACKV19_24790 [Verrucomicrobiales bacterium]
MRLLADPGRYDGQIVIVSGVASVEYENVALYVDEGSYDHAITANAFWLGEGKVKRLLETKEALNGQWLRVVGRVNAKLLGTFELFSGTLHVDSIREVRPAKGGEREKKFGGSKEGR